MSLHQVDLVLQRPLLQQVDLQALELQVTETQSRAI